MPTADTTLNLPSNLNIEGDLQVQGTLPEYPRDRFQQESYKAYDLPPHVWRVWDAYGVIGTAASDDLGITAGTFGTALPYISTGDVKASTTTRYARTTFLLPPEYVAGGTARLSFSAGMLTTISDTSCTLDAVVYESADTTLITGSDLVSTAAQSINSLTFATKRFDLTVSSLVAGDVLDIRIAIATVDAATATAVIGAIAKATIELAIKG